MVVAGTTQRDRPGVAWEPAGLRRGASDQLHLGFVVGTSGTQVAHREHVVVDPVGVYKGLQDRVAGRCHRDSVLQTGQHRATAPADYPVQIVQAVVDLPQALPDAVQPQ